MIAMNYEPEIENVCEKKDLFAELVLRNPSNPFQAAQTLFPGNMMVCSWVSLNWVADAQVLSKQKELMEEFGPDHFLPSKESIAWLIYDRATAERTDNEEFVKLMKLFCDVRGFIEKQSTNIQTNNTIVSPVMLMPAAQTDDEWEKGLIVQQERLTNESVSS